MRRRRRHEVPRLSRPQDKGRRLAAYEGGAASYQALPGVRYGVLHRRGCGVVRAYLRLDPAYDERKSDYPDGPYATLIACFCLAEMQPTRGRFRSLRFLKALLAGRGRHVKYLIDHGDLVVLEDGRVYVDGWDEWQEGDWKVGERVARVRNRRKTVTPQVTVGVTPDVTVGVTVPTVQGDRLDLSEVSGGGGGDKALAVTRDDSGIFDAYYRLTGRPPSRNVISWINRLTDEFGDRQVITAVAEEHKVDPDTSTLLGRVQTRLADQTRKQAKAAEERGKRRAIDEARALEDAMPLEQRQANTALLGEMLREKGLLT